MRRVLIPLFVVVLLAGFVAAKSASAPALQSADDVKVWVDTAYSFYHCPATKWYGKTKQGVYMTQKQARDRGYRPVYGVECKPTPTTKPTAAPKPKSTTTSKAKKP